MEDSMSPGLGRTLVVVAHPDDEALGCGGTIAHTSRNGSHVFVAVMCGQADARRLRPESEVLMDNFRTSLDLLGAIAVEPGTFPNIQMNTVPHIELVKHIEALIVECEPRTVITHHPSDLNDDHRQTASAVMTAVRLPQRLPGLKPVHRLMLMETLSATDWSFSQSNSGSFAPNMFVGLEQRDLEAKLEALGSYRGVMRPHPHPRSPEAVRALAALRGAACGVPCAEAFVSIFELSI
jgi:LmbE family N-acetylglucosaminyl deacetylase